MEQSQRSSAYDTTKWLYVPDTYSEYRYILGTRGHNPVIVVGINPSTAAPGQLDNTLKSVERIAVYNGFDSFIMFNVYAQRATDPDRMNAEMNKKLHTENMEAFKWVVKQRTPRPAIWAAWGTVIEKRPYLLECLQDMVAIGRGCDAKWYHAGPLSKRYNHPHHPLYLKSTTILQQYNIQQYMSDIAAQQKKKKRTAYDD